MPRTFTEIRNRCRGCGYTFRVSQEAIAEARAEYADDASTPDADVAEAIDFCLRCALGEDDPGEERCGAGVRVRLRREVDRYPHFIAPAGALGTIADYTPHFISVHLDTHVDGAEEWGNHLHWADDAVAHFADDVEAVDE